MSKHKKMYLHLFNTITDTIETLKKVQQETEKMYIGKEKEEERCERKGKKEKKEKAGGAQSAP